MSVPSESLNTERSFEYRQRGDVVAPSVATNALGDHTPPSAHPHDRPASALSPTRLREFPRENARGVDLAIRRRAALKDEHDVRAPE
jgi:hypothetical protein